VAWPLVLAALDAQGINTLPVQIAAAATIQVEVGKRWRPVQEGRAHPVRNPRVWALQERYWPSGYFGRGWIQITWADNYREYGQALGVDLLGSPDLALEPETAAAVLALYFKRHKIPRLAANGEWIRVRRAVNGGDNGLQDFLAAVRALSASATPNPPETGEDHVQEHHLG